MTGSTTAVVVGSVLHYVKKRQKRMKTNENQQKPTKNHPQKVTEKGQGRMLQ